jgi:hypothetical protein
MNATCPKGYRNDIPSGQGKNLHETVGGYEADFSCPDRAAVFRHGTTGGGESAAG